MAAGGRAASGILAVATVHSVVGSLSACRFDAVILVLVLFHQWRMLANNRLVQVSHVSGDELA